MRSKNHNSSRKTSKILWAFLLICGAWRSLDASAQSDSTQVSEFKTIPINGADGIFAISNSLFHLSNSATNQSAVHLAIRPFSWNGHVVAQISRTDRAGKTGLLFRQTTSSDSAYAGMFLTASNVVFERLLSTNESPTTTTHTNVNAEWLRVVREGNAFSGFYSGDGTNWIQVSADTIEMPKDIFCGFAVAGKGEAVFENVQLTSAHLTSPPDNSKFVVPTNILLKAEIASLGCEPSRVEFFADAMKIGEATMFPYTMEWTNALAGPHSLISKVASRTGLEYFTEPVVCEVKLPQTRVEFLGTDVVTKGTWKGKYGVEGFHIIGYATNYPAYADVLARGYKKSHLIYTNSPGALQFTNENGGIIAGWMTHNNMSIDVSLIDGNTHRVTLYFQDWGINFRSQIIRVIDPVSARLLDSQRVDNFGEGKHLSWNVTGVVRFQITQLGGSAVISGIFFDIGQPAMKPQ